MVNEDENVSIEILLYLHHLMFFNLEEHFDTEIPNYG